MVKEIYRFAVVDWVDSAVPSGRVWWYADQLPEMAISWIRSAGYVVRKNAMEIVLASGIAESASFSEPFGIPMGCIKRIKYVKLPK